MTTPENQNSAAIGASEFSALLYSVDGGRFVSLRNTLRLSDTCLKCSYFNQTLQVTPDNLYRCKVAPGCVAATLAPELISYLLWKTGIKTEAEHHAFAGYVRFEKRLDSIPNSG